MRENLVGKLQEADPACICGPIGVEKKIWFKWFFGGYVLGRVLGKYEQCSKDGTGIHLVGRFVEWEYYNMDAAMASAMLFSDDMV